jgi:Calcineurin-like phosphoesterase
VRRVRRHRVLAVPRPARALAAVVAAALLGAAGAPGRAAATTLFAVGDAADGSAKAKALADAIVARRPDGLLYLGDVYESGTATQFGSNYEPLYGPLAGRTSPVIGNHEMPNRDEGYYPYWAAERGWPARDARHRAFVTPEGWQVIAYSSEHQEADFLAGRTRERDWFAARMAEHQGTCRIIIAHKGRYTVADASHDDNPAQEPIWRLMRGRAALNVVAHNHIYGRLAPIDGVTVIVSGAGGHDMRPLGSQSHPVAAALADVPAALRLTLRVGEADFQAIGADGTVHDAGRVTCTPPDRLRWSGASVSSTGDVVPAALRFADPGLPTGPADWVWDPGGDRLPQSAAEADAEKEAQAGDGGPGIAPDADAHVKSTNPTQNYGTSSTLRVRREAPGTSSIGVYRSYLRFRVSGLRRPPASARLRVRVVDGSADGLAVWPASSRWTEEGLSWRNAPAFAGPPLARIAATSAGTWLDVDVTRAVSGNGRYTFVLAGGGTDSAYFASRESISPPRLVVRP